MLGIERGGKASNDFLFCWNSSACMYMSSAPKLIWWQIVRFWTTQPSIVTPRASPSWVVEGGYVGMLPGKKWTFEVKKLKLSWWCTIIECVKNVKSWFMIVCVFFYLYFFYSLRDFGEHLSCFWRRHNKKQKLVNHPIPQPRYLPQNSQRDTSVLCVDFPQTTPVCLADRDTVVSSVWEHTRTQDA